MLKVRFDLCYKNNTPEAQTVVSKWRMRNFRTKQIESGASYVARSCVCWLPIITTYHCDVCGTPLPISDVFGGESSYHYPPGVDFCSECAYNVVVPLYSRTLQEFFDEFLVGELIRQTPTCTDLCPFLENLKILDVVACNDAGLSDSDDTPHHEFDSDSEEASSERSWD